MKRIAIAIIISLASFSLLASEEADHGKSCDMGKSQSISLTGKVACKGDDDCTFQTADAKTTYTICEMSKADLPKLSSSGATVSVTGKLVTCEGKEKLVIEKVE